MVGCCKTYIQQLLIHIILSNMEIGILRPPCSSQFTLGILEPETKKIIRNVEHLPIINSPDSLLYHDYNDNETLFVEDLSECLIPQQKLATAAKIKFLVTFVERRWHLIKCGIMWEAIYSMLFVIQETQRCHLVSVRKHPCGFCVQNSCFTLFKFKKYGNFLIASNYPYHYSGLQYKEAAEFSMTLPCKNVPIHCFLCPTAVSGDPPTIWKYNVLYHLISEHPSGSTPPSIPGQLLV